MNKSILGGIIALLVVAGLGGMLVVNNKPQNNQTPAATPTTTTDKHTDTTAHAETTPTQTTETAPSSASETSSVSIQDSSYLPAKITVKKGTKVTWTNKDSLRHDVAPDNPTDEFKTSELLGKDETYSVTFNTPGTYSYHCTPHPFMKGTVEVTE